MWLSLLDTCFKLHFNNAESKTAGRLEQFNDLFVILGGYVMFCFTPFVPDPELKETIGWFYVCTLAVMAGSNLLFLL